MNTTTEQRDHYKDTNWEYNTINFPGRGRYYAWYPLEKATVLYPAHWIFDTKKPVFMEDSNIDQQLPPPKDEKTKKIFKEADIILLADEPLKRQDLFGNDRRHYAIVSGYETQTHKRIHMYIEREPMRKWFNGDTIHGTARLVFMAGILGRGMTIMLNGKKKKIYIQYILPALHQLEYLHWLVECHTIQTDNIVNMNCAHLITYSLPHSNADKQDLAQCDKLVQLKAGERLVMPPRSFGMILDQEKRLGLVINVRRKTSQVINSGGLFTHSELDNPSYSKRLSYMCIPIKKIADHQYQLTGVKSYCSYCESQQFYINPNHVLNSMKHRNIHYHYETEEVRAISGCKVWDGNHPGFIDQLETISIGQLFKQFSPIRQSDVIDLSDSLSSTTTCLPKKDEELSTEDRDDAPTPKLPKLLDLSTEVIKQTSHLQNKGRCLPNLLRQYIKWEAMNYNYLGGVEVEEVTEGLSTEDEDEELSTEEGDEELSTEEGDEELSTEEGDEELSTEEGDEELSTEEGDEELSTKEGDEALSTEDRDEELSTEEGDEELSTEEGDEELSTKEGDEELSTKEGDEALTTEDRDDAPTPKLPKLLDLSTEVIEQTPRVGYDLLIRRDLRPVFSPYPPRTDS